MAKQETAPVELGNLDGKTNATPGGSTTYTIVVSNSSPSTATNVPVIDPLPADVTLAGSQSGTRPSTSA